MNLKKNAHLTFITMASFGSNLKNRTLEKLILFLNSQLRITKLTYSKYRIESPKFSYSFQRFGLKDYSDPSKGIEIKPRSEKLKAKIIRSAPYANQ